MGTTKDFSINIRVQKSSALFGFVRLLNKTSAARTFWAHAGPSKRGSKVLSACTKWSPASRVNTTQFAKPHGYLHIHLTNICTYRLNYKSTFVPTHI